LQNLETKLDHNIDVLPGYSKYNPWRMKFSSWIRYTP
jgi:hypothetical protein